MKQGMVFCITRDAFTFNLFTVNESLFVVDKVYTKFQHLLPFVSHFIFVLGMCACVCLCVSAFALL